MSIFKEFLKSSLEIDTEDKIKFYSANVKLKLNHIIDFE